MSYYNRTPKRRFDDHNGNGMELFYAVLTVVVLFLMYKVFENPEAQKEEGIRCIHGHVDAKVYLTKHDDGRGGRIINFLPSGKRGALPLDVLSECEQEDTSDVG